MLNVRSATFWALLAFIVHWSIILATSTDSDAEVFTKRSAICLIERVAQQNNITANYQQVSNTTNNDIVHIKFKLQLGTESYEDTSTTKNKAKEKCAREAYAKTKYSKPALKNRTCLVETTPVRTDAMILYEYATLLGEQVAIDERQVSRNPNTYQFTLSLHGKSASSTGAKKSKTKEEAANQLLEKFGKQNVINALVQKYNDVRYHKMGSAERLRKILIAKGDLRGVRFNVINENLMEENIKKIVVKAGALQHEAIGKATTLGEAKNQAAATILRLMNFTVA